MSCQDISTIFQSRKELLMKHIQSLAGAILLASSCLSHAAVVNTIDAGAAVSSAISPLGQYSNAPVSENGFTWTSTYVNSMYGWSTSPYILGANGQWDGKAFNYAGLNYGYDPNDHNQHMKFTFDTPVSSVLAFLNYAPGSGNPYMAIFDSNDNLIDQAVKKDMQRITKQSERILDGATTTVVAKATASNSSAVSWRKPG